jgi:polysaccharide export outer membrane protein
MTRTIRVFTAAFALLAVTAAGLGAERQAGASGQSRAGGPPTQSTPNTPPPATEPPDFTIGLGDVIHIFTYREPAMTGDFLVRPDGKISMPMLKDEIRALGLTPTELRDAIVKAAVDGGFYTVPPQVNVTMRQINSRMVTITGNVNKPGEYALLGPMTIIELIQKAGGLTEYADKKNILIFHTDKRPDGSPWSDVVNYEDILNRRNLPKNNIPLRPGDSVIVR